MSHQNGWFYINVKARGLYILFGTALKNVTKTLVANLQIVITLKCQSELAPAAHNFCQETLKSEQAFPSSNLFELAHLGCKNSVPQFILTYHTPIPSAAVTGSQFPPSPRWL